MGQQARGADGRVVGRIVDITARLGGDSEPTYVHRIQLHRERGSDVLVPASAVVFAPNGVRVTSDDADETIASVDDALHTDEILLVRDVLDTQIVDIAGQRLARVADVVLAHRRDVGLEIVGAEIGFAAVLRRLGLPQLARKLPADTVAWSDLHLTSERGHSVQLATPRSAIHLLDARGLAMLVARLDTHSAAEVLATKEADLVADVIETSHPAVGERVLRAMSDAQATRVVDAMPTHHAEHWRRVLATPRLLRGRRLLRSHAWPRRHHLARDALR